MTPEEKKLGEDYARYCAERDRMAAEGVHIGTFSSWAFKNGLIDLKIALRREDHFGHKSSDN